MLGGILWLDSASSKTFNKPASAPVLEGIGAQKPPLERQDVDALLAVDFSGSMVGPTQEKATDPSELRLAASELMISSLAADIFPRATRIGYLAFGTEAEIIQPLSSVENPDARKNLINRLREPNYSNYTNIAGALSLAYDQFYPNDQQQSANTPVLVLLTDGDPRGGGSDNNETGIRKAVQKLTDKGALIFVIIVRNPTQSEENPKLTEWRSIWNTIANTNPSLKYLEAQRAEDLENIYNKMRGRLVNEGARPGERRSYDPHDANASIEIPPNLLQADLVISRPVTGPVDFELIAPDGTAFTVLEQQESRNQILSTGLYNRYKLYRPTAGKWTIRTARAEPIYYVLNVESLYSGRVVWPVGGPYLHPDQPTLLPLTVIDTGGKLTTKPFTLKAAILRNTQKPGGEIVEEEQTLPLPTPSQQTDGTLIYTTQVAPEMFGGDDPVMVQIDGQADDGTPLNLSVVRLPLARTPTGVVLNVPQQITCSAERVQLWPPAIQCSNLVTVTLDVQASDRLVADSLQGEVYTLDDTQGIAMRQENNTTLRQTIGPFTTAGTYGVTVDAHGRISDALDLEWGDRQSATIELVWPAWVPRWQRQLPIGATLLGILGLWKPVLVALLLPIFRRLGLAPSGYWSTDGGKYTDNIYQLALKRRKLFTVTIGRWNSQALDIRIDDECLSQQRRGATRIPWMTDKVERWLCRRPLARLVAFPGRGIYTETDGGFDQAPIQRPTSIRVARSNVQVCQSDWT